MRNKKGQFVKGHRSSPETEFKKGEHWRNPREHWDREWLYKKYIEEKMSSKEIAELQGCSDTNILHWLKKHNIPKRTISEARKVKHWGLSGEKNGMYGRYGEESPNWKGGITPERQALYSSSEWKKVSSEIRERDKNKCQKCKAKHSQTNILQIHHIVGFSNKELRLDPNNLILLCRDCHSWVHSKKNTERRFLG